jgi:hydrogenase maturation protein HypF
MTRLRLRIKGRVQGVGFRPFVFNLACSLGLRGFVKNSSQGVVIEIEGDEKENFLHQLRTSPPPLAEIESIETEELPPAGYNEFTILESTDEGSFTHVSPDVSTCEDCLRELLDPSDRRYLYPFINCTNCGPRYSITEALPYDRPNTTMRVFRMCPACEKEYHDPRNRRFHAQPNACAKCGPVLEFKLVNQKFKDRLKDEDPLVKTIELLSQGGIVAIKGLGGFHIACNADNAEAIKTLRTRKGRGNKPFALMAPDIETIERYCYVDETEKELLASRTRPIVLLRKRPQIDLPEEEIAPDNCYLGFMLPYTPLHYLLFYHPKAKARLKVLVMTSGNLSEEPIVHKNEEAIKKLSHVVDAFLLHNRDIFMRVDDSVITKDFFIRRARGYVPEFVKLPFPTGQALAVGADLKNTFTLTKEGYAIVSQHIGDMENLESYEFFQEVLDNLCSLYRVRPERVVADLHPDYYSVRLAEATGLGIWRVQHHEAHVGAVMAEWGLTGPVLGIVFDGTGYGTDGTIWGSEFLVVERHGFQRLAHMRPFVLVGGEKAIKEPWRQAVSVLRDTFQEEALRVIETLGIAERLGRDRVQFIYQCIQKRELGVLTAGAGRLFDAAASIIGLKDHNTFEAEAPIALEAGTDSSIEGHYHFDIIEDPDGPIIDWRPAIKALVEEKLKGQPTEVLSTRFHRGLAEATVRLVSMLTERISIKEVTISGGVFQNRFFLGLVSDALKEKGFEVFFHRRFPPNDGCISLGQAFLLWWRYPDG